MVGHRAAPYKSFMRYTLSILDFSASPDTHLQKKLLSVEEISDSRLPVVIRRSLLQTKVGCREHSKSIRLFELCPSRAEFLLWKHGEGVLYPVRVMVTLLRVIR